MPLTPAALSADVPARSVLLPAALLPSPGPRSAGAAQFLQLRPPWHCGVQPTLAALQGQLRMQAPVQLHAPTAPFDAASPLVLGFLPPVDPLYW